MTTGTSWNFELAARRSSWSWQLRSFVQSQKIDMKTTTSCSSPDALCSYKCSSWTWFLGWKKFREIYLVNDVLSGWYNLICSWVSFDCHQQKMNDDDWIWKNHIFITFRNYTLFIRFHPMFGEVLCAMLLSFNSFFFLCESIPQSTMAWIWKNTLRIDWHYE